MAAVAALKFPAAEGAIHTPDRVRDLQNHLIKLHDAAFVSWPEGRRAPRRSRSSMPNWQASVR